MKYEADKAEEKLYYAYDAVEFTKKKMEVEGAVGKIGINYDFQHTWWSSDKSEDAQVQSPSHLLEEESTWVHKRFRHRRVDWAVLYPRVEYFQGGDIDLMDFLPLSVWNVCNQMVEEDKVETE